MKVVLFCGGYGMRMRDYSESIPKPMVKIGYRPILWHVMKYYAHFGHRDFILCLGWNASAIKHYFLSYDECVSNDFVLSGGGNQIKLLASDINDWNITFVDTGMRTPIGQRLKAVEPHINGDDVFLANYTDGLSNVHLPAVIDTLHRNDAYASFVSVRPTHSFHAIRAHGDGSVYDFTSIVNADIWMNGGYFVFRQEVFQYIHDGEDLLAEPFRRLIDDNRLCTYKHEGFWSCMDTFKEKQVLDDMYTHGETPWEIWKSRRDNPSSRLRNACPPGPEPSAVLASVSD